MRQVTDVDRAPVPPAWMYKSPEELSSPPENADGAVHTVQKKDVYSFGSTLYAVSPSLINFDSNYNRNQLYTSNPPFPRRSGCNSEDFQKFCVGGHGAVLKKSENMSEELWNLLNRCWRNDSRQRPDMSTLEGELESYDV